MESHMTTCDEFIEKVERQLPEPCTAKDLVSAGLYKSEAAAAMSRYAGTSPAFMKIGGKVIYPKSSVIKWLYEAKNDQWETNSKTVCSKGGVAHCCG